MRVFIDRVLRIKGKYYFVNRNFFVDQGRELIQLRVFIDFFVDQFLRKNLRSNCSYLANQGKETFSSINFYAIIDRVEN